MTAVLSARTFGDGVCVVVLDCAAVISHWAGHSVARVRGFRFLLRVLRGKPTISLRNTKLMAINAGGFCK